MFVYFKVMGYSEQSILTL